jgi:hypothetical protein
LARIVAAESLPWPEQGAVGEQIELTFLDAVSMSPREP